MKILQYMVLLISITVIAACGGLPSPFLAQLGGEELYIVQGTVVHAPEWSSTGSQIVFTSTNPKTGRSNVYILDINTLDVSLPIKDEYFSVESWSAESEIALSGPEGIWIVESTGGMPINVTQHGQIADWAPFGRTLAISESTPSGSGASASLHVIDLEKKSDTVLYSMDVKEEFAVTNIAWSPDGTKIAFSLTDGDYGSGTNIYILELQENKISQLTHDENYNRQPVWSPDSKVIAYLSSSPKSQATYIVFSNMDGSCLRRSENIGSVDIAWSPDGRFLAFTRDDTLYSLDLFKLYEENFYQEDHFCQ